MLTFPTHLFNPASIKVRRGGVSITGGESLLGETDTIKTDGGGFWVVQMTGIELRTPDLIRAWRAWEDTLEGGTTQVLVPVADVRQAPRPMAGGRPSRPSNLVNTTGDPYFPEAVGFASPWIVAVAASPAPLRSTTLRIDVQRGARLKGGEMFSVDHPGVGRRVYRVGRILEREALNPQVAIVTIRPPLREAVLNDQALDFDWPSFAATVMPDSDTAPDIGLGRYATVDITFREAFNFVVPASEPEPTDPYWDNVELLVGTVAGEPIDQSSRARTLTQYGSGAALVTTSPTSSPFGTPSIIFPTASSGLVAADSAGLDFGDQDYTVETWAWFDRASATEYLFSKGSSSGQRGFNFNHLSSNNLEHWESTNGTNFVPDYPAAWTGDPAWHHLAVERAGGKRRIYVDGAMIGTTTSATTIFDTVADFIVGNNQSGIGFIGKMFDPRVTKGVARYNTDAIFDVPTAPFPRG